MNESKFLNFLQPYFEGRIGIERFFEANSEKLDSSTQLETQTEYFALARILYDYGLLMLNEGKTRKSIYYLDEVLIIIDKIESIFQVSAKNEKLFEYTLSNKGTALLKLKKYKEAILCFDELIKIQPDNDDYKEYQKVAKIGSYAKYGWALYILAMLIWTLIFSEKYVGKDFMPRWTGDFAWVAIVIGMIILYGLPFMIKKRHSS
jgi:tetratricopeptide (TPR) repeat protein